MNRPTSYELHQRARRDRAIAIGAALSALFRPTAPTSRRLSPNVDAEADRSSRRVRQLTSRAAI